MKILFLGEGKLAQICLEIIMRDDSIIAAMVTSESFHDGFRAEHKEGSKILFISNSVRNEDQILKAVNSLEIEVLISVQHKWILSEEVISSVRGKAFNLHNARLPDYKGHNTISHAILNDEKEYFVTIHWLAAEVDSGDRVLESSVEVDSRDTALSLYKKTLPTAKKLFKDFLRLLKNDKVPKTPLTGQGTYFGKSSWLPNKMITLNDEPDLIDKKTRASYFPPHEPARLDIMGKKIYCLPDASEPRLWEKEKPLNKSTWDECHSFGTPLQ